MMHTDRYLDSAAELVGPRLQISKAWFLVQLKLSFFCDENLIFPSVLPIVVVLARPIADATVDSKAEKQEISNFKSLALRL